MVFILAAYLLVQLERLSAIRPPYLITNGLGAFLILVLLANEFNLSAFAISACVALDQRVRAHSLLHKAPFRDGGGVNCCLRCPVQNMFVEHQSPDMFDRR